jgi:argininosuccinate lyase
MKLWQKDKTSLHSVENFTVGNDRAMDRLLAPYDVLGSLAHLKMLTSIGLVSAEESRNLHVSLQEIYTIVFKKDFEIDQEAEDIHSQIESMLTLRTGEAGKKIHTGRSRNDQVLLDLKLFFRAETRDLIHEISDLFALLLLLSELHKTVLIPGYTHFQIAMPSSFGLWFSAYAESLSEDLLSLEAAYRLMNKNPLGSAAGYGSSFPLNRELTTQLLGFETMHINAINAQMSRGKTEKFAAQAIANVAATLSKLAYDCCLFMNQNYKFIAFPDELTTGSSIMPHKKNPDVFELIRAKCNALQALPNEITLIINNLPHGYHRDFQILKEKIFPSFQILRSCLQMMQLMLENVKVTQNLLDDEKYKYLFTVESVNRLVMEGVPFRTAYKTVGLEVENGTFEARERLAHTHLGSIGNLGLNQIKEQFEVQMERFQFGMWEDALMELLK